MHNIADILQQVANGTLSPADAEKQLPPATLDLGFAQLDIDRERRCGLAEVVYCPGKSPEQVTAIMQAISASGQNAFATRASKELFAHVHETLPAATYHDAARAITLDVTPPPAPQGAVAVVAAGTADLPVAEEAALTASRMGAAVDRVYDVGVAGIHRLVRQLDRLRKANVLVVVAGMEGALPSVVGGLLARPLIAVPTSIGYGTGQGGKAALLAMLNSCVPGISVVNIDNGFGAGVAAALINRLAIKTP
ncbi:MAG: nickel pincer cofactor biosynthesis protein LarB [Verrucomicrobia bacterium]|nr:nickel pincer cofactor biosynthesis protein LarB [Verrucomicrobiota bacterium]